jgi:serine/threonine protein kinase/tetratricopeptide (TPR) repeat protein
LTSERWAQIEELFHRAAECALNERARILEDACIGDPGLRREVEALLNCDGAAGNSVQAAVRSELTAVAYPLTGETLSHYRILDGVGGGGMGLVYRAEDIRLGRQVALKFLPEESVKDHAALGRFEREARAASALEHPNICPIYEFGEHEGQPFLVMQLLEGQTLRELISAAGQGKPPLELSKLLDLAIQIVNGLDAAHRQGFIHRDIKPANIFVTHEGQAKILDFGLAKLTNSVSVVADDSEQDSRSYRGTDNTPCESVPNSTSDPFLSRTGVAIGTAGYMSPEQVRGEKLDARTDLFSFGLVLYEMATGERAFAGCTGPELQEAILKQLPTPVRQLNPNLPAKLEKVIHRALEKDRERRYQTAAEIRSDLTMTAQSGRHIATVASFLLLRQKPWNWILAGTTVVALLVLSTALVLRMRRPPPLNEADLVLVSDFVNTTGEPVFDGTLKQALTVKLAESPYFNIALDTTTRRTLGLMGRSADERVVPPIAREVCQREGAKVVVVGSILNHGNRYTLDLNTTNCLTGTNLAHQQIEDLDKELVLNRLGQMIPPLRRKLGESVSSIQKFDTPIEQATTKSLAALKAYTSGEQKRAQGQEAESIPSYKMAIELDPDFAIAYARLAATHRNLNERILANEYLLKAFELRERVSEKEKFYIQVHYYDDVAGDNDKTIETYQLWTEVYPHDFLPFNGLSTEYTEIGQPDKAIAPGQQALRLNPKFAPAYATLSRAYERATQFTEARAICEKAVKEKVDSFWTHQLLYRIAFTESDEPAMQRELDWSKGKPQESTITYYHAKATLSLGELRTSRELFERARAIAQQKGLKEQAVAITNGQAQFEADLGNVREARAMTELSLRATPNSVRHKAYATLALARAGDIQRAQSLMNELNKQPTPGTGLNEVILPSIRAAIDLDRGNPAAAVEELRPAIRYDLGSESGGTTAYYRGLAYLELKSGKEAAAQFQKILDNRGVVTTDIYWPLARLGLARAFAQMGDVQKSLEQYREVLAFWKNADPDLRFLKEAKAEYKKLNARLPSDAT